MCDEVLFDRKTGKRPMICRDCTKKIKYISEPSCYRCGKPLEDDYREYCQDCDGKEFYYGRAVAAFAYSDAMKASMYGFKYNNRREYAGFYADSIVKGHGTVIRGWNADVIVPVPLHVKRLRRRGYNQAEVFGNALSARLGIPADGSVLVRTANTVPLKTLNDKERANNIKNAFQIAKETLQYKKIIIVDDIYTTGTTVNECARVLREAGATDINVITVCVGRGF